MFVTLLPTLLAFSTQQTAAWLWTDFAGVAIWTAGFLLESVADFQKFMFKVMPICSMHQSITDVPIRKTPADDVAATAGAGYC